MGSIPTRPTVRIQASCLPVQGPPGRPGGIIDGPRVRHDYASPWALSTRPGTTSPVTYAEILPPAQADTGGLACHRRTSMATNSPIRSAPTAGRPAGDRPGKHSRCGRVTLVAYTTRLLVGRVFHACLVTMPAGAWERPGVDGSPSSARPRLSRCARQVAPRRSDGIP